jgi:hypothetical protein
MVESVNGIYFAWHAFADYGENGSTFMKECILYALNRLLDSAKTLETNLPSLGTVGLQHQKERSRYVNHLIYAFPVKRGKDMEVIEDIVPIRDIEVALRLPVQAKKSVSGSPDGRNSLYARERRDPVYAACSRLPPNDCDRLLKGIWGSTGSCTDGNRILYLTEFHSPHYLDRSMKARRRRRSGKPFELSQPDELGSRKIGRC